MNWMPGSQSGVNKSTGGGVGKFAPNGVALSPPITGFTGMGIDGVGWGTAVTKDRVWISSFNGKILVMDFDGKPVANENDFPFKEKFLGLMGVGVSASGDVWIADGSDKGAGRGLVRLDPFRSVRACRIGPYCISDIGANRTTPAKGSTGAASSALGRNAGDSREHGVDAAAADLFLSRTTPPTGEGGTGSPLPSDLRETESKALDAGLGRWSRTIRNSLAPPDLEA
jgi:hypothetical protein